MKQITIGKRSSGRESSYWGNKSQYQELPPALSLGLQPPLFSAQCTIEGRPRHIDRSAHIFIYRSWIQGREGRIHPSPPIHLGPDLQSPGRADASADEAKDALAFPFFDEVLCLSVLGYCAQWTELPF